MFSPPLLRSYSTSQAALKLWVKHNGAPSTQVPIKGCSNIDDFAEKVKQKLNLNCQVAVFSSLDKEALDPGFAIKDLLKMEGLRNNTSKFPLYIRLIPVTQDSIATKTIYIGETDDDGKFIGEYKRRTLRNDRDLKKVIQDAQGLVHLSSPDDILVSFEDIKDGEEYHIHRFAQNFQSWQKKEADAMEEEIALAMKNYLHLHLGSNVIEMPTEVNGIDGKVVQEWDAALKVDDVLYLCEAKHTMSIDKVPKIPQRIKTFKEQFQAHAQEEFSIGINKIVGVACGTYFPPLVREKAHQLGLICVYPSGWRYSVEKKLPNGFEIEF
jgi:hypothetical protein